MAYNLRKFQLKLPYKTRENPLWILKQKSFDNEENWAGFS